MLPKRYDVKLFYYNIIDLKVSMLINLYSRFEISWNLININLSSSAHQAKYV